MPKIDLDRLRTIIREELSANLLEGADHDAASKQMSSAAKLLSALESFKETASEKIKAELGQCLEDMDKLLNRVIASPMQYVDATKEKLPTPPGAGAPAGKKVTLKTQKSQGVM